jgi:hypothetical protein
VPENKNPDETVDDVEIREHRVLNVVVSAMRELDRSGRERLLRTIATFFGLDKALRSGPDTLSLQNSSLSNVSTNNVSTNSHQPAAVPLFSEDRSQSPKQFLLEKRPRTDVDRIACLAYYLTHYREQPHFKTLDLSLLNTEAAQIKFSNAAQAVDNATKSGLLVPATKGQKQLSALGEVYVQLLPDNERARLALSEQRPRRKPRKKSERS